MHFLFNSICKFLFHLQYVCGRQDAARQIAAPKVLKLILHVDILEQAQLEPHACLTFPGSQEPFPEVLKCKFAFRLLYSRAKIWSEQQNQNQNFSIS